MNKSLVFPFLVADIGGTNARFGMVDGTKDNNGRFIIEHRHSYLCADYASFESVFEQYLQTLSNKPRYACIAIAGPVIGDLIQMTNLNWCFSIMTLRERFAMTDIKVINDFGALAYATLYLQKNEVDVLYDGNNNSTLLSASRVVIGPGTGLGISGLIKTPNHWQPVCGEGGHVSFAALNNIETELRNVLLNTIFKKTHLSIEDIISGPGLVNLYRALCHINNVKEQALTASEISSNARNQSDKQCIEALQIFSQVLGSTAGDIALTMGAFGGVYLGGGILPKILDVLDQELLIERYLNKGIQHSLLANIPLYLVSKQVPGLTGAAHWMYDTTQ